MFPFNYKILLRCLNTRSLMYYAKTMIKGLIVKLKSIICSYNFDTFVKLSLHIDNKAVKKRSSFTSILY